MHDEQKEQTVVPTPPQDMNDALVATEAAPQATTPRRRRTNGARGKPKAQKSATKRAPSQSRLARKLKDAVGETSLLVLVLVAALGTNLIFRLADVCHEKINGYFAPHSQESSADLRKEIDSLKGQLTALKAENAKAVSARYLLADAPGRPAAPSAPAPTAPKSPTHAFSRKSVIGCACGMTFADPGSRLARRTD